MSFFNSETWAWFKTAPLPVVLSLCLSSFTVLATWSFSQDSKIEETKGTLKVLESKVERANEDRKKMEKTIEDIYQATQATLLVVTELKAKQEPKKAKGKD